MSELKRVKRLYARRNRAYITAKMKPYIGNLLRTKSKDDRHSCSRSVCPDRARATQALRKHTRLPWDIIGELETETFRQCYTLSLVGGTVATDDDRYDMLRARVNCPARRLLYVQAILCHIFHIWPGGSWHRRLRDRHLSGKAFARLTHRQLMPIRWQRFDSMAAEEAARRRVIVRQSEILANANDGFFRCMRCKSMKTVHHQLQTRSADEPLTTFVHCLACGRGWTC